METKDRLFVPLNRKWYDLFYFGEKTWEIRGVSNRFNPRTVYVGRSVELRNGYQKKGALWGWIVNVETCRHIHDLPTEVIKHGLPIPEGDRAGWDEISNYNARYSEFIAFKIGGLNPMCVHEDMEAWQKTQSR